MAFAIPTFNGNAIFGQAVSIIHVPNAQALQMNAFFGLQGVTTLFGGTRGRIFLVRGVLVAEDIPTLNAYEAVIDSYNDGNAYVLSDTRGRSWSNVQYRGEFKPDQRGLGIAGGGTLWSLAYEMYLHGLQ